MANIEHVTECETYKMQKAGLLDNSALQRQHVGENAFKPYTGEHTMVLVRINYCLCIFLYFMILLFL